MYKKILVASRGVLAAGKAQHIARARIGVWALSRRTAYV